MYTRSATTILASIFIRTPFNILDTNTSDFHIQRHEINENISKRKVYICKVCGQTGHNTRICNKQN